MSLRWRLAGYCVCALLNVFAGTVRAQPQALVPLPPPHISIDHASPSIGAIGATDVLDKPGPSVTYPAAGMGLSNVTDELDELSGNRSDVLPGDGFVLIFCVDRATVGLVPPDPNLVALNRPFNVMDQSAKHQASADTYMTLDGFNRAGPLLLRAPVKKNNTLVINEGDSGGVDYDLKPTASPMMAIPPATPIDAIDGMMYDPPAGLMAMLQGGPTHGTISSPGSPRTGTPKPLFFSVTRNSTSKGIGRGADIFYDPNPTIGGNETLFAPAVQLGLLQGPTGDEIDGLIVFDDNNDHVLNPGELVIFSLARGSPSLGPNSAADIFFSIGNGIKQVFCTADVLGLRPDDNVTALELVKTEDVDQTVYNSAIFQVIPGDFDHTNTLNPVDCGAFSSCFSGSGNSYDTNGVATHTIAIGPGDTFSPPAINVEIGDIVTWTWTGGVHNVVSGSNALPDGIFNSGPPTGINGTTFSVTFNEALMNLHPVGGGIYHYFSQTPDPLAMTGTITVMPHPCATFDLDFDGDVDCVDWQLFQSLVRQLNENVPCPPLSVDEFVAALLGAPFLPAHNCMADMNGDGTVNGRDIAPYIVAFLGM